MGAMYHSGRDELRGNPHSLQATCMTLTLMVELEAVGMHGAVEELGVGVVLELAEDGGVLQQQHEHADHVRVARLVVRRQLLVT